MSFKGEIEAKCPKGCEPFAAEVWSYVRGDQNEELRNAVLAREFNLLLCPGCGNPFFPDASYVYFEPEAEILAFVFPESYREKEAYWREKMHSDFAAMKGSLGEELNLDVEPELFFGVDDIGELLEGEDWKRDERDVAEFIAKDLGLSLYRVKRGYARKSEIPALLPFTGKKASRDAVLAGLAKLVAENDRLTAYKDYLDVLAKGGELPPEAPVRS
jgi:hypothetical protein